MEIQQHGSGDRRSAFSSVLAHQKPSPRHKSAELWHLRCFTRRCIQSCHGRYPVLQAHHSWVHRRGIFLGNRCRLLSTVPCRAGMGRHRGGWHGRAACMDAPGGRSHHARGPPPGLGVGAGEAWPGEQDPESSSSGQKGQKVTLLWSSFWGRDWNDGQ